MMCRFYLEKMKDAGYRVLGMLPKKNIFNLEASLRELNPQ